MKLRLSVTAGPHQGKEFTFDGHDTFLVGRVKDAHLQLSFDDPYFSRRHFLLEVNPPRCRLMDLESRNGTEVNGSKVTYAELKDGDIIKAGTTIFQVHVIVPNPETQATLAVEAPPSPSKPALLVEKPLAPLDRPSGITPIAGKSPEVRSLVPGYELIEELGRGAMGVVYKARRLSDGRPMAVKTIITAQGASQKQIDRFIRETRILEKLQHPNIIGFQEAGLEGNLIYLAMELVTGPDLAKILVDRGPLPVKMAVRIISQLLVGLSYAHHEGFVHRDIKPSNMLIHTEDNKKTTKLADFGLARAYDASQLTALTMQGELGGTPAFMPPEQITHFSDVRPSADQYSAAATLYNLLTDRFVYDLPRGTPQQLIHITVKDPIQIRERRSDIPAGLATVIHKALNRESEDRYADVDAFRKALVKWA